MPLWSNAIPRYLRNYVPGGTYFFTLVTEGRQPILTTEVARTHLRESMQFVLGKHPVSIEAIVLLPDHLHTIWTLPPDETDYSLRWGLIKEHFTRLHLASGGEEFSPSASRSRHRERAVWQRRFWEHTVRDESDMERCFDYIHWNPVKHGLVKCVRDYPWSTFHRWMKAGVYDRDWGEREVQSVPGAEWE